MIKAKVWRSGSDATLSHILLKINILPVSHNGIRYNNIVVPFLLAIISDKSKLITGGT